MAREERGGRRRRPAQPSTPRRGGNQTAEARPASGLKGRGVWRPRPNESDRRLPPPNRRPFEREENGRGKPPSPPLPLRAPAAGTNWDRCRPRCVLIVGGRRKNRDRTCGSGRQRRVRPLSLSLLFLPLPLSFSLYSFSLPLGINEHEQRDE